MDVTLLTENQIYGDEALDAIKRYGTKAAPTDLVIILGGTASNWEEYDLLDDVLGPETAYRDSGERTSEGEVTCPYWTSSGRSGQVSCVSTNGDHYLSLRCDIATRPVLPASEASQISPREVGNIKGIPVVEYGEYLQTVADESTSEKLERLYLSAPLHKTGKNYTFRIANPYFDAFDEDEDKDDESSLYPRHMPAPVAADIDKLGHPRYIQESLPEYEMGGKKYIRVPRCLDEESKLPTGEQMEEGKPYWVEVQPIEWLKDESGIMIAKKCLFAGIAFNGNKSYDGDFSKTSMKHYLDTYFAKEIEPSERVTSNAMFLANLREKGGR